MNIRRASAVSKRLLILVASALFIMCTPYILRAQDVSQGRTTQDIIRRRAAEIEIRDRIRDLTRPTEIVPDPDVAARRQRAEWINQLKEDYKRIQLINNSLRAASGSASLDYKSVSDLAEEMKKRAHRLMINLALPKIDDETGMAERQIWTDAQIKALFVQLDGRVVSFVSSPLFKEVSAVDIEMATRASRDLKDIMILSEGIKRMADSLRKTLKTSE